MKKHIVILIACLLSIPSLTYAQEYPRGAYMSLEEIISRTPSLPIDLSVIRRTNGEIKMNGGNDYKLESEDPNVKNSFLKKDIWAYSDGDGLYLNCRQIDAQPWYTRLLSDGRYMIFTAGISSRNEVMRRQRATNTAMGVMFGAIGGGISGAQTALMRFLYVLDKENGQVTAVDSETLRSLIGSNDALLNSYLNEPDPNDEETQIKYLQLLNYSFGLQE